LARASKFSRSKMSSTASAARKKADCRQMSAQSAGPGRIHNFRAAGDGCQRKTST
jgi:hypothetical protein